MRISFFLFALSSFPYLPSRFLSVLSLFSSCWDLFPSLPSCYFFLSLSLPCLSDVSLRVIMQPLSSCFSHHNLFLHPHILLFHSPSLCFLPHATSETKAKGQKGGRRLATESLRVKDREAERVREEPGTQKAERNGREQERKRKSGNWRMIKSGRRKGIGRD